MSKAQQQRCHILSHSLVLTRGWSGQAKKEAAATRKRINTSLRMGFLALPAMSLSGAVLHMHCFQARYKQWYFSSG